MLYSSFLQLKINLKKEKKNKMKNVVYMRSYMGNITQEKKEWLLVKAEK